MEKADWIKWRIRVGAAIAGAFKTARRESGNAKVSLVIALAIPAVQTMGVTVNPWLATALWIGVLFVVADSVWQDKRSIGVKVGFTVVALLAFTTLVYRSFAGPILPMAKVEVLLFENPPIPVEEVEYTDVNHFQDAFEKFRKMHPSISLRRNISSDGRMPMNVIIRNATSVTMRNASVNIISNIPIRGDTAGVLPFSETSLNYDIRAVRPFSAVSSEYYATISFVPPAESGKTVFFLVTIESDNSIPLTVCQLFRF